MSDTLDNGISFNLATLNWGEVLNSTIDPRLLEMAVLETLDELEAIIENHFADRESSWKALAARTIRERKALGYAPTPILGRSGTLRENVAGLKEVEINGLEIIGYVSPADVTTPYSDKPIGEYAAQLDKVRPFYDLSDEEAGQIYDILEEKLAVKLGFI